MDFEVLKKITLTRQTIKEFNSRQLDQGVLEEILGYSLRTPTSMNLQPYRMIIVRDAEVKESLSLCMSKKNENTVREAAASIIVCSDMQSDKCIEDFGRFTYKDDWKEKTSRIRTYASVKYTLNTLSNVLFGWIYNLIASVMRWFRPYSGRITMQSWSQQQAAFLIQNICLLAESKGISSAIMNGFSEDKLRAQFKIPDRFEVAAVVSLGYKKEGYDKKMSARFPFDFMMFDSYWKQPFANE